MAFDLIASVPPPVLVSDLHSRPFRENFAETAVLEKKSSRTELGILPNWQFLHNNRLIDEIAPTTGKSVRGGIYACAADSLLLLSTETNAYTLAIAFSNDCGCALRDMTLAFTGVQVSFKETGKTLFCEYCIANRLAAAAELTDWTPLVSFEACLTAATRGTLTEYRQPLAAALPPNLQLPRGALLYFRWRDVARKNSPIMGLSALSFSFAKTISATVISIR